MDHLWPDVARHLWLAVVGIAVGNRTPWLATQIWRLLGLSAARDDSRTNRQDAREESEIVRQSQRIGDLEDLIDGLRSALDRHLIRESAIASACELLIMLAGLIEHPSDAMLRIRDRAQQLLEDARRQTSHP